MRIKPIQVKTAFVLGVAALAVPLAACNSSDNNKSSDAMSTAMSTSVAAPNMPAAKLMGNFTSLNNKSISGMVTIEGNIVTLTNFSSDEGPDLHLYLANGTTEAAVMAGKEIGKVDYDKATQTFTLPSGTDAANYTNLVENCDKAKYAFGAAGLTK